MRVFKDMNDIKYKLEKELKKLFKKKYPGYTVTKVAVKASDPLVVVNVLFTDPENRKWQLTRVFGMDSLRASKIPPFEVIFERIKLGLDSNLKGRQQSWQ